MAGNLAANLTKLPQESFCTAFLIGASQAPLATPVADISSGSELICYFPTLWPSGRSLLKYVGRAGCQSGKTATGVLMHSVPHRRQPSAVADISSGNELTCYFPTLWPSGRSLLKYGGKFGGQSDKTATGVLLHSVPYRRQPSALGDSCGRHLLRKWIGSLFYST